MQTLEARKYKLIWLIMQIEDEQKLMRIEKSAAENGVKEDTPAYMRAVKPLRKGITLEQLADEQTYTGFSWEEFCKLRQALAIEESAEELIALL